MTTANRRQFLTASTITGLGMLAISPEASAAETQITAPLKVRYCLNTSTIRGQNLSLEEEIDLVGVAGYDGIEPWIGEIERYRDSGKSLPDLKKKIEDKGLRVESAIGFAKWIVDDEVERKQGLEQLKRDMDLVHSIGGTLIAAPPIGMHEANSPLVDLFAAAERYAAILEIGRNIGVIPQVEVWGFSKNLSRLGESMFVVIESGDPDACLLADVYHIYKGGSSLQGLLNVSGQTIRCFHFNDYPAEPPRTEINDSQRVYPGDGVAPWKLIIETLRKIGFNGAVSLELFNETYWKQDAKLVVETGLQKMKAVFENN
ncbi:sugar phosphate isomerase/epimerase family protein [Planctomicrobium sp. SH668]|uniref:sugar phosphate isomerase/epimerase family protein n=1 Tax=Planctomicrobium sp. SH668 TaxID=3448126 RepID=UPI003F5AEE22